MKKGKMSITIISISCFILLIAPLAAIASQPVTVVGEVKARMWS